MMKTVAKIEAIINKIILLIYKHIKKLVLSIVPLKFQNKIIAVKLKIKNRIFRIKRWPIKKMQVLIQWLKVQAIELKNYDYIGRLKENLAILLGFVFIFKEFSFNESLNKIKNSFNNLIKKIVSKIPINRRKPIMYMSFVLFLSVIVVGFQIQKILRMITPEEKRQDQKLVIQTKRAPYYNRDKRHLRFNNINLPVYIVGSTAMKALLVDIVVESSNRRIISFLLEKEHEVRDYLNTAFEPVLPWFPIKDEGKRVLRDKIKDEMNNFLKKNKIEGTINAIHIQAIIAG